MREIILKLRQGRVVTQIPGYRDLAEFSADWRDEIQKKLEDWQKTEGFLELAWIKGLEGKSQVSASRLARLVRRLADQVNRLGRVAFARLQIPGITSHAWLITGARKEAGGVVLDYIDSNRPDETLQYEYRFGDQAFQAYGHLVPYLGETRELERLEAARAGFCVAGKR